MLLAMSVSLGYFTPHAVPLEVRVAVEADARTLAHHWWHEPLHFHDVPGKPGLAGSTKLFVLDCNPEDNSFMALRDACTIVHHLVRWSEEHHIEWVLTFADEDIGCIKEGVADAKLAAWLHHVPKEAGVRGDASDDVKAQALALRHRR